MIVAIEGIDGAGKSHLCHLLTKRLRQHGIRVRSFDKHTAKFGDDFAGRRMCELRSILWPNEAEPAQDPLGTRFYLYLLSAWFHGLARLAEKWAPECDIILIDGSYYRVIAKAHARSNLDLAWLATLFEQALQPDRVLLLDIDPSDAWRRRDTFKSTEIGQWDGEVDDARAGFCAYQGRIRAVLRAMADLNGWAVLPQTATTTPDDLATAAERALAGLMPSKRSG